MVQAAPLLLPSVLLCSLSSTQALNVRAAWRGTPASAVKGGLPDEVNRFLRSAMDEGDLVQPLDWTGGAVHGMLMARARLATRFMYDFHFYHHVSDPYIQQLRAEFMRELTRARPRFIVEVVYDKPWPKGADTTHDFPALQSFLAENYVIALSRPAFRVLQRRDSTAVGDRSSRGRGELSDTLHPPNPLGARR